MNWISNYVRPKINSLFSRREVPENLWSKCPECGTMLFHRELHDSQHVCTNCDHHMQLLPRDRFEALFDGGIFVQVKVPEPLADPLHFRDQKAYPQRLKDARKSTGEAEAMLVAEGEMGRTPIVAAAQDFSFMAGSMGMYVGNAIVAAAERAVELKRPLILFSAAGGARMQEGILSLMQMPRTTVAIEMLKEAGLPYIVVLTHPTTGGVTASLRDAGRRADCRAECSDLLCRSKGHRTNHPRKASRGLPARRISSGPWHARPRYPPPRIAWRTDFDHAGSSGHAASCCGRPACSVR